MMTTLYLSDLDGTLLMSNGVLAAATRDVINRLVDAEGMLFAYATARSFASARVVVAGLDVCGPVAVYGGALIVDGRTGHVHTQRLLSSDVVEVVLEQCRKRSLAPLVYEYRDGADRVKWLRGGESVGVNRYLTARQGDPRLAPVTSWRALAGDGVFYVTVIGERAPIERVASVLGESLAGRAHLVAQQDTYHPEETWLEISAVGANKAAAAQELCTRWGARRLVCFGDNANDLPMFAVADESYAVAGAVSELRALATGVIGSNDADAVARHLLAVHALA